MRVEGELRSLILHSPAMRSHACAGGTMNKLPYVIAAIMLVVTAVAGFNLSKSTAVTQAERGALHAADAIQD